MTTKELQEKLCGLTNRGMNCNCGLAVLLEAIKMLVVSR